MQLPPIIWSEIDSLIYREVQRLQEFVPWVDIFSHSGKSIDAIIHNIKLAIVDVAWPVDLTYSVPWMTQASLKKWVWASDLRVDSPNQVIYPVKVDTYLPITNSLVLNYLITYLPDDWIFSWFVHNIEKIWETLDLLAWTVRSKQDILILSNHATWFNLPLIAHCLHRFLNVPQENIYTILWPAITHSHWSMAGIIRYSNLLKTYPDTPRAKTGYSHAKMIQENFLHTIRSIFSSENTTASRVLLLSPSGTTDKIIWDTKIIMSQPSSGSNVLVQMLMRRMNLHGFAMGVNDTSIIPVWHSRPRVWQVFTAIEEVNSKNWKQILPECILDQYWKSIWQWRTTE